MSTTTPLLHGGSLLPTTVLMQDHPVFLRACHSPWRCIPQNVLVFMRGTILAYLVSTAAMTCHYKLTQESEDGLAKHFFDFSLITFAMVLLFHLVTFAWTYTHLYHPDPDDNEGGIEGWIVKAMSLPRNMASYRKQFYYSMFYTASSVFCFMNSTIYWFITRQHDAGGGVYLGLESEPIATDAIPDAPFSDLFGEGWFMPFIIVNLHGCTSVLMALEMLFLNSIKRPAAIGFHIFGLMFLCGGYLVWAAVGKATTGVYPFFWLDGAQVGSKEAVSAYCMGFVMLAPIMYTLMQGFVGIREGLTRCRPESRRGAHESLDS